jgi:hypothetical protein
MINEFHTPIKLCQCMLDNLTLKNGNIVAIFCATSLFLITHSDSF